MVSKQHRSIYQRTKRTRPSSYHSVTAAVVTYKEAESKNVQEIKGIPAIANFLETYILTWEDFINGIF